jgi:two-component system cell cycle sensor histidine kinase/response regulator CckA
MRLTTDVQGGEQSTRTVVRSDKPAAKHPSHTHENSHNGTSGEAIESAEYSALLARATNDAVRVWNVTGGELSWPQGLDTLLGYNGDTDAGKITFWQQRIHPDDRSRTAGSIREALAAQTLGTDHWSGEYRFRRADGSYADLLERAVILRDGDGMARRFVGSLMDITARKHLHDQVSRAQKMEAFGQLAGAMAHDFNNFLTTILGYSDLLLNEMGIKGGLANHVSEIRSAAARASALTGQLLAFSRKHPLAPRVLEVNSLVTNLERSLLRLLGENVRVTCELHEEKNGAHIQADPGELTQVILNLAVNARDAMPNGGSLTIRTAVRAIAGEHMHEIGCEDLPPGEYILISVTDTGTGISEEVKERLFEPFFTTKEHGVGSGLGLATSYGIVRQSGGHIGLVSDEGNGTRITIYLPKVEAPPALNHKRPGSKKLPVGTETILVLEDDISVRHISVRVLRSLGYDVIEAANGDDAQRLIAQRNGKNVHLLLTDLMMPEMSGRDFAAWLEKTSPDTKVVFVSGYLDASLQFAQHCDHAMYFLPKPFDPEQLATKVRQALDA